MDGKGDPRIGEWLSFAAAPGFNLAEKCLKTSQILEYPQLEVDRYVTELGRTAAALSGTAGWGGGTDAKVRILNGYLYSELGFCGADGGRYDLRNYLLNDVMDRRTGRPAAMAVLYSEVARLAGMDPEIVRSPCGVLVRHGDGTVIDPSSGTGGPPGIAGASDADSLQAVSDGDVLAWLVRDLGGCYARSFSYGHALLCAEMAAAVCPGNPADVRDRGIILGRMLDYGGSIRCLEEYLEQSPNADDADFVLELISDASARASR